MSIEEIKKFILTGCKYRYFSYDHKNASIDYLEKYQSEIEKTLKWSPSCWDIPDELKEKYKTEKIGKLRQIHFNPKGEMYRFKIGAKYAKTYYADDFGKTVFPILENQNKIN